MDVKNIAVIGAGTAGRGIAYAAVFGGYWTVLEDVSQDRLVQGVAWIAQTFEEDVSRRQIGATVRNSPMQMLSTAPNVEDAIRDADLIIETVPEELEMKLELFTIFDKFAKPRAIFASNATSLSITDMTDVTVSRDRCIGMHFCNNDANQRLIKLVQTPDTSEETVAACREVARRMGRETTVVRESPDFVITRVRKGSND